MVVARLFLAAAVVLRHRQVADTGCFTREALQSDGSGRDSISFLTY